MKTPNEELRARLQRANDALIGASEHHAAIKEAIAALAPQAAALRLKAEMLDAADEMAADSFDATETVKRWAARVAALATPTPQSGEADTTAGDAEPEWR